VKVEVYINQPPAWTATAPRDRVCGGEPIAGLAVLTQLGLADERSHGDLDADDVAEHLVDVLGRRVRHLPGMRLGSLVPARQSRDQASDEALVVTHGEGAVRVHHLVVPGRHLAMRLLLARVPAGRDVALGAVEDHHGRHARGAALPQRVGARHVGRQRAQRAHGRVELERDVVGIQAVLAVGDQGAERVLADDPAQGFGIGDGEVARDVHR
jgi:hypothetical protein